MLIIKAYFEDVESGKVILEGSYEFSSQTQSSSILIDKNKADADRQFAELLQLLKALQPPTTLPATIPRFEKNSGQCFSSDKVEKEELILMSMDKGENEFADGDVAPVAVVAPIAAY
ncbi:hypothetical protein Tco_1051033 [Tanacetum coccineum]